MAVVTTNLGVVTAYGDAVAAGYTGTKAEWQELMASYATVAEEAAQSATDAETAKNAAVTAKTGAETAKTDAIAAKTAAQTAQTAAETAQGKAETAQEAAQTAATTATNKASEATTAEQTATTKAGEASTSASTATSAKDTAVSASQVATSKASEAAQSATSANTAKTEALTAKTAAETAQTAAETAQGLAEDAQAAAEDAAESVSASAAQIATNTSDISDLKEDLTHAFPHDTVSGAVASFADGADDVPMDSVVVSIDPVQSGSGDPSPSNVRPISGWSEVNVSHSGADMTNPTVISIQLGQTVYGGTLDVPNGVLTVDRAMVDLGSLSWEKYTAQAGKWRFGCTVSDIARAANGSQVPNIVCEVYKAVAPNDTYVGVTGISNNVSSSSLFICDLSISEKSDLVNVINGKKVVYPLATPITVQLTPHEVRSLLGSNNVWADSGDSAVEYRADPTLYIGRLTEPDADMVADANITSGSYFMVGNTLYKATANIASGGAITPNVNCTRKSLSEALNEINA